MGTHFILAALPILVVAGVLLLLGARLRGSDLHLIAGYDPNRVRDKAGVGRLFGLVVGGLGVAALAVGVVQMAWPGAGYRAMLAFGVSAVIASVIMLVGRGRYEERPRHPPTSVSNRAGLPPNDR